MKSGKSNRDFWHGNHVDPKVNGQTLTAIVGIGIYLLFCHPASAQTVESCDGLRTLHSVESKHPVTLTFQNLMATSVKLVWLNYKGETQLYAEIAPGQQISQPTFKTNRWVIADANNTCLAIFVADRSANINLKSDAPPAPVSVAALQAEQAPSPDTSTEANAECAVILRTRINFYVQKYMQSYTMPCKSQGIAACTALATQQVLAGEDPHGCGVAQISSESGAADHSNNASPAGTRPTSSSDNRTVDGQSHIEGDGAACVGRRTNDFGSLRAVNICGVDVALFSLPDGLAHGQASPGQHPGATFFATLFYGYDRSTGEPPPRYAACRLPPGPREYIAEYDFAQRRCVPKRIAPPASTR